jgi:hypothetical protein
MDINMKYYLYNICEFDLDSDKSKPYSGIVRAESYAKAAEDLDKFYDLYEINWLYELTENRVLETNSTINDWLKNNTEY